MNGFISARDAATKWDISVRQVQKLCAEGRIKGVTHFANAWAIPEDASKPTRTSRVKTGPKPKTLVRSSAIESDRKNESCEKPLMPGEQNHK